MPLLLISQYWYRCDNLSAILFPYSQENRRYFFYKKYDKWYRQYFYEQKNSKPIPIGLLL